MYNFNERTTEYSARQGKEIPVGQSPKYEQSKKKAIEIIEKYDNIGEGDFWILMNESKKGKMIYTGLIISHNACLKINDAQPEESKFDPECVSYDKEGYKNELVFTYCNKKQGIYEVGEVSQTNCKNDYPYAMAFKRCFDRVVLKLCKLAYDGIYSDSEADEFKEPQGSQKKEKKPSFTREELENKVVALCDAKRLSVSDICKMAHVNELADLTIERLEACIEYVEKM